MSKRIKLRDQTNGRVVPTPSEWTVRRNDRGAYRDVENGRIGYGRTYGEQSFNYRPVHAEPVEKRRNGTSGKVPFDPFDAPPPEDS